MFRCIIGLTLLLTFAYCQNCQDQVQKYKDCLQQRRQEQQNAMKEAQEKAKENTRQCFTKNQCKEPNFDNQGSDKGGQRQGWGKGKGKESADGSGDKRRQCHQQVSRKARDYIEKCVQKTQADFHFPQQDNKQNNGDGHQHGGGGHFGGMNVYRSINESCPEASREAVRSCLKDSNGGQDRDQRRQEFESRFNQSCQAKQTCFNGMDSQCQTQFNQTKKALCDCAQEMVKSQKTQLDQEYDTCAGVSSVATTPATSQFGGGRWGGWGRRGQRGSGVDSMARQMCSSRDFCQGGGGFHAGGGRGKFGGGNSHKFGGRGDGHRSFGGHHGNDGANSSH